MHQPDAPSKGVDAATRVATALRRSLRIAPRAGLKSQQKGNNVAPQTWLFVGGILAALAVAAGAFGAHGLESRLDPAKASSPEEAARRTRQLENFKTAAQYQLTSAIGIVLAGFAAFARNPANRSIWPTAAAIALVIGIILFSGGLYAWVLTERKAFVAIVPIGGTSIIIGWTLLAVAGLKLTN